MEEFKVIEVTGCVSEITLSFSRDLDIEKARQPENYVIQPPDISKMEPFAIGKIVRIKGLKLRKGNEYRIKISDKITDTDGNPLPPENREVVFTYNNQLAKWNYVTIAYENSNTYAISEGIKTGDSVIFKGNLNLAHDAKVILNK